MKVSPLMRYADPRYPARDILDDHPELLRRLPNRWQRSAVIGAAVIAACGIVAARWQTAPAQAAEPVSKVAPIFQHGNGNGGFGCMSVNPPALLYEDEARQVITEEFKRIGMTFTADKWQIPGVELPYTRVRLSGKDPWFTRTGSVLLDGFDTKSGIAYEYVSATDFHKLRLPGDRPDSSVWDMDIRKTAELIRSGLVKSTPKGYYAVFYDPAAGFQDQQIFFYLESPAVKEKSADSNDVVDPATMLVPISLFSQCEGVSIHADPKAGIFTVRGNSKITFLKNLTLAEVDGKQVDLTSSTVFLPETLYVPFLWTVSTLGGEAEWITEKSEAVVRLPKDGPEQRFLLEKIIIQPQENNGDESPFIAEWQTKRAIAQAIARQELRQQVRDFIVWLKAEGVI